MFMMYMHAVGDLTGVGLLALKQCPLSNCLVVELVGVVSDHLNLIGDTEVETWNVLHDEEHESGADEGVGCDGADLGQLLGDLDSVAVNGTWSQGDSVEGADG